MLEVVNVYFKYPGGSEVLKGASFSVRRGEVVAIIGRNGSGKTTLLLVASGLLTPQKGEVLLDGEPLDKQLPEARRRMGLVFQDPDDQLFNPTVYDELAFAPRQLGYSEEDVKKMVEDLAGRLGLSGLLGRPPYKLSMGEKRKVALASVLVYNPELLLLDEPTANLSAKSVEELVEMIGGFREDGKAVVVTSHDVEFVARVADRVYVLYDGITLGGGAAREVLTDEGFLRLADAEPPYAFRVAKNLGLECKPLTLEELLECWSNTRRTP